MAESVPGLVSVIIPVYRNALTLVRAVDSVLAQEGVEVEVILVDDCSPDDSVAVAEANYGNDPRVRLFRQPRNRGQSAARNRAIEEARGEWLTPLDGDDMFRPGRLARLLRSAREQQSDIVMDAFYMCDAQTLRPYGLRGAGLPRGPATAVDVVRNNLGPGKPLFRAAFLRASGVRYCEEERHVEDMRLLLELLLAGARFYYESEPGYAKVFEPQSVTADRMGLLPQAAAQNRYFLGLPAVQADAELTAALARSLRYVEDALAANRLRAVLGSRGWLAALGLLAGSPATLPATLRHLLFRKRRFGIVPAGNA